MGSMKVFMKVEGIAGSSMEKGRSDWSDVRGFDHSLAVPVRHARQPRPR